MIPLGSFSVYMESPICASRVASGRLLFAVELPAMSVSESSISAPLLG